MPAEQLEYAIRRLNWRRTHYGIVRMPGASAVGALPSFEEAEADRSRREAEVRARITNPFICGPSHPARSRLPEPIFCDWLRDAGIEPTQPGQQEPVNWVGWWEQTHKRFSAERIAHVWAGLDRLRFFEVVSRSRSSVGYAVVRVDWEYNDTWYEPGAEGGTPMKVFLRKSAAELHRRELEGKARNRHTPISEDVPAIRYETTRWTEEAFWPLGLPSSDIHPGKSATIVGGREAPFYEIVEVELPELLVGDGDE